MKQEDFFGKEPVFVIGYPKSGNTWLTRLTGDALDSRTGSGYLRHASERATEGWERQGPYFILKSHYSKHDKPHFLTEDSKIIYIVRDFRDVLISAFFASHPFIDDATVKKNKIVKSYFLHQIKRTIPSWKGPYHLQVKNAASSMIRTLLRGNVNKIIVGDWSAHVRYWTSFSHNVVMLRYEDLLERPHELLSEAFDNLFLRYNSKRVDDAIHRQSFSERKGTFMEKGDLVNARRMRRGRSGEWREILDGITIRQILEHHGAVLNALGYETRES